VENVHEILGDSCPTMESIRSETSDWSDPVISITARETRDVFFCNIYIKLPLILLLM